MCTNIQVESSCNECIILEFFMTVTGGVCFGVDKQQRVALLKFPYNFLCLFPTTYLPSFYFLSTFRPLTLINITAQVFSRQLPTFTYSCDLFKCQHDYYSSDNLRDQLQATTLAVNVGKHRRNKATSNNDKNDDCKTDANKKDDNGKSKVGQTTNDADMETDTLPDRCQQSPDFNDEWIFNEVSVQCHHRCSFCL